MATTTKPQTPHLLIPTTLLLLVAAAAAVSHPDQAPLLGFKSACTDPLNRLRSWAPTTSPCTWPGVSCSSTSTSSPLRVTRLVLESHSLLAPASSLSFLSPLGPHLRVLSLKNNLLWGPLPASSLSNLTGLRLLFLSHNNLSGPFPLSLLLPAALPRLYRLDLSFNSLSGPVPLPSLDHLLTLRLEGNRFSGLIQGPTVNLSSLMDFNVSSNQLTGPIPASLSGFPRSAFSLNRGLCGYPLQACKGGFGLNVSSSPGSIPMSSNYTNPKKPTGSTREEGKGSDKISTLSIIAIVVGDFLILGLVSVLLFCYFSKKKGKVNERRTRSKLMESTEKIVYSSSPYAAGGAQLGPERGRMVFFESGGDGTTTTADKRFELEDLLRASAEMLGKGGFGTAYKAVLDDGAVVAVKRLKDAGAGGAGRREFEQQMELLGRVRHPNLVELKAYYFAREEKLLVYEYMPNGSLFWLLHGNRGPGRTPLDWTTRLKIAAGAARGLAFIHSSCKALKLAHGNIKSTNVLLDKSGTARVSDFGLALLASPASGTAKSNGYRAPELAASDGRKPTQRSDVYSFGVLLLEILTGKSPSFVDCGNGPGNGPGGAVDLPRWVQSVVREEWTAEVFDLELMRYKDIEEEMVGLLQVAMACTAVAPDQRPRMSHVVKMIEEIRGIEVSPCHDNFDSVSDSPCLSEDTCGAASQ